MEEYEERISDLESQVDDLQSELKQKNEEITEKDDKIYNLETKYDEAISFINSLDDNIRDLKRTLNLGRW